MNQNEPRMQQLNRMPVPPFLQRQRAIDILHKFLPDMVNIKADIKAYKKSPGGRSRSPGGRPRSPGGRPMSPYPERNPMGGSWKPSPRRPKMELPPYWDNHAGFGEYVQVLVNTHSYLHRVTLQVSTWIGLILI